MRIRRKASKSRPFEAVESRVGIGRSKSVSQADFCEGATAVRIEEHIPLLEEILGKYQDRIGIQFDAYRNHVYRVLNYCFVFHPCDGDDKRKLIIAGCFHDLGIWPDDNVDYLAPSIALANEYLTATNQTQWAAEITQMIDLHHQCRSITNAASPLVEVFRKGDWVDASLGWCRFGLSRALVRQVSRAFPNLGFHRNLVRLATKQFFRHPLNPLPMMKW